MARRMAGAAPKKRAVGRPGRHLGHQGVVGVEHGHRGVAHRGGGVGGGGGQFPEAVQLVPGHVGDHQDLRPQPGGEGPHRRLVHLEHRHVGIHPAPPRGHLDQAAGDAPRQVGAGAVGDHLQALALEHGHQHLGGGGLAVGAGDHDHPAPHRGHQALDEARVDLLGHQAGQGRAAPSQQAAQAPGEAPQGAGERRGEARRDSTPGRGLGPAGAGAARRRGSPGASRRRRSRLGAGSTPVSRRPRGRGSMSPVRRARPASGGAPRVPGTG